MSSAEFGQWLAFYEIEPFGDWWRAVGKICWLFLNRNRIKAGKAKEEDFMPISSRDPAILKPRQTPAQMFNVLLSGLGLKKP